MATLKLYAPLRAPTTLSPVCTVTVSPATNGLLGRKLPPLPSESPATVPECGPLTEPVTVIDGSDNAFTPLNVICVRGGATRLPGIGNA